MRDSLEPAKRWKWKQRVPSLHTLGILDSPCTRTVNARVARRKQDAFNYFSFPSVASMEAARAELNSSESSCIAAVARKHGIKRTTLSRRRKGVTTTRAQAAEDKRSLNNQQEQQLIKHIRQLCDRCLPPTPAIVVNIASHPAGRMPGGKWCSLFVKRHKDRLDSRYLNSLDIERHQPDSLTSCEQFFSILGKKMEEYQILSENTYNMGQKGFLIGRITKAERFFPKDLEASEKLLGVRVRVECYAGQSRSFRKWRIGGTYTGKTDLRGVASQNFGPG